MTTDPQRLLALGGILLIASGMLFGDIFAIFALHPNNARIGEALYGAAQLIPSGDADGILALFMSIGGFLEFRGTKVDTHSHIIHMGYIALLLAILQPWVALSADTKRRMAWLFIISACLMPVSIFLIHYVGLAYSPFSHIGWASISADFFGALLAVVVFVELLGLWRFRQNKAEAAPLPYIGAGNNAGRLLLIGGLLLLVAGFLYGAAYAAWMQSGQASSEVDILKNIVSYAANSEQAQLDGEFATYGAYQMCRAINIASHTHINEMGILLLLVSFLQSFVNYRERIRDRWAKLAVIGAFGLPIGILMEIPYGFVGSFVADVSGFIMIASLMAMLFGLFRHTGASDATGGVDHE